jgi:hypothetical protein
MPKNERLILNECPGWWNVESRDGFLCESFNDKRVARAYQRLANRTDLTNREIWRALRTFVARRRFYPVEAWEVRHAA